MGFLKVITKSHIVGLLAVLVLGFLFLRTGDEPTDSGDRSPDTESAAERRLQPKEPAFLQPSRDYGIAGRPSTRPDARKPPVPYGAPKTYRREAHPESGSAGYGSHTPYGGQAWNESEAYRFRPLSEKEKVRIQGSYAGQHPEQYAAPMDTRQPHAPTSRSYRSQVAPPQPIAPAPYSAPYTPADGYPDPHHQGYSFRPFEQSPGARGRWQGPYQEPGQRQSPFPMDPWAAPSPQWGSTPPAHRMYPNLYRESPTRLTAR